MARVAFVTGGTRGIGKAIVQRLSEDGVRVAAGYSGNDEAAQATAAALGVMVVKGNVASFDDCARAVREVEAELGPIDILVNNAGITRDASLRKMSYADWNDVLRSNLDSMFNMTQPLCGPMADRGWGRIVNISSVNGSKGAFGQTNYAASKAGIHGFTKSLALELARKGVTVNTVSPGYLATRMVEAVPQEVLKEKILPQIPLGRLGQPDEIAALVAFICSDAAAFMTGSNVAMNGGQHMY